ncbi:MAG: AAA family ATPase, partial [Pyrobaculum sp.]
ARYIVDHIDQYRALVIDSINGLVRQHEIDLLTHSVFYQISQKTPVIIVAEEKTPRIDYIVDHIIHLWYKINSMGHLIRYAQLEKSRIRPPGPRYILEILEGIGVIYIRYRESIEYYEWVEEPIFGKILPKKALICLHSTSAKNLAEYLSKFENAMFVKLGPWTSFRGIAAKETFTIKSFHDMFKLRQYLSDKNVNYLIVGGTLNLKEDEIVDYIMVMGGFLKYVNFLILVSVGPEEELERLQKYCDETVVV